AFRSCGGPSPLRVKRTRPLGRSVAEARWPRMDIERRYLKRIDWVIILILVAFCVYGYIGISGANTQFGEEKKQIVWYAVGFGAMFAVLLFDYKWIGQLAYGLYGFGILLLVLV